MELEEEDMTGFNEQTILFLKLKFRFHLCYYISLNIQLEPYLHKSHSVMFFNERPGAKHFCHYSSSMQNYKDTLQAQVLESVGERLGTVKFGTDLAEGKLNDFQGDQIGQLYELMLESTKPNRQFNIQEDIK